VWISHIDIAKFVSFKPATMNNPAPVKNLVLYADDDQDDLALVSEAFSEYTPNVELVTFRDGAHVLGYLEDLKDGDQIPCLVILDINMPRLNGKDTLKKLRQIDRLRTVPVVLFTTSSLEADKEFASKYNAGFLKKPIDATQMDTITRHFISQCSDDMKRNFRDS
jgi:CheY-like chemotaxis protein